MMHPSAPPTATSGQNVVTSEDMYSTGGHPNSIQFNTFFHKFMLQLRSPSNLFISVNSKQTSAEMVISGHGINIFIFSLI